MKNDARSNGHDDLYSMGSGVEKVRRREKRMEPVVVRISTRVCSVVEPALSESANWVLDDGRATIPVAMRDWRFQERVSRGDVVVAPGDVLVCRLRIVDQQTPVGLEARQEIVEVRDHRVPGRHPGIPTMPAFS